MKPRHWGLRVAGGILGQVLLIAALLAVLQFAPREYVSCPPPVQGSYPTPVPAAGGVAVGVWLLAALLSFLLIRGFRRRPFIATAAGPSRKYPAIMELGCVISLLVLASLCALLAVWLAFSHPVVGCLTGI
jgi:hypothetical protein